MSTIAAAPGEVAPTASARVRYVGLATRAIAMVIDAALINLVAVIVGVGASLILSILHLPSGTDTVLQAAGAAAYVFWTVGYFIVFWSTTGQTPGARVMLIRVVRATGVALKPREALVRCAGVLLAAIPLFAGFVPILFDDRRRGFQDWLAGTVVIEAAQASLVSGRRAALAAAYQTARPRPPKPSG